MKKVLSLLVCFCLMMTLVIGVSATADATLTVTAPTKQFYLVGEEPDYTGGSVTYTAQDPLVIPLSADNCTGLDTTTPGNKTVTVKEMNLTAYFRVTVLNTADPIYDMKDVYPKQWYYSALAACMKAGFFEGDENKNALPNGSLTRAQLATLLYRVHESDPRVMAPKDTPAAPFTDVQQKDWFYDAVENCRVAGIITGMGDGTFQPNATIKREDAILMIVRTLYSADELETADPTALLAASGLTLTDFDRVSGYAKKAMALGLGTLIKGDDKGALNPKSSISRAETATILYRQFLAGYEWMGSARRPLIYLSPSNQIHNRYKDLPNTEGYEMIKVANLVETILLEKGYQVINADVTKPIKERAKEGTELMADVYVALHTNAGGGANATGTEAYYNGANPGSKELATEIYNRIITLTGKGRKLKEDYLCLMDDKGNFAYGTPFVEVGDPKVANLLLEIEFHDKADKALWITQNTQPIAKAVAEGIIAYVEQYVDLNAPRPEQPEETPPEEPLPEEPPVEEPPAEEPPAEEPPTIEEEEELPVITGKPPLKENSDPEEPGQTPEQEPEENEKDPSEEGSGEDT